MLRPSSCSLPLQANSLPGHILLSYMHRVTPALRWVREHAITTALLLAYTVMSLVIVEQGRIIDNQRSLIRQLFSDSLELSVLKTQELRGLNDRSPSHK
jgi:hypothetical protein